LLFRISLKLEPCENWQKKRRKEKKKERKVWNTELHGETNDEIVMSDEIRICNLCWNT
jgi:hypothetical protein